MTLDYGNYGIFLTVGNAGQDVHHQPYVGCILRRDVLTSSRKPSSLKSSRTCALEAVGVWGMVVRNVGALIITLYSIIYPETLF